MAEADWKREFESMGEKAVRGALIGTRWDNQKRAAAREWLERSDAHSWQSSRASRSSDDTGGSTFDAFRRYRWVYYVVGGAFGLFGLAQMLHR